ncbi:hypothetical protein KC19_2G147800 [Ceratodon purpureus]|uniref:Protein kinase domain-containing protein n=1 Tax=Ceratodon purpureus TaxID=3225 RepID=A0A8T0IVQ2_CERPU|nr:hypothetical protein KC19_2G147800 [Ceratodon purpureus]
MGEFLDFLNLAGDVVKEREKAIVEEQKVFLVNQAQCTRLWKTLKAVYDAFAFDALITFKAFTHDTFAPRVSYFSRIQQICLPLIKRFYMAVMRADAILSKCSCEKAWLEVAIFYGDNPHAFKELYLELQLCVDLFQRTADQIEIPPDVKAIIHEGDEDEDFAIDLKNLMERLEAIVEQTISGEKEEQILARYLLDREKSRLSPDREDSDPNRPRVERFYEVHRYHPVQRDIIGMGGFGVVSEVEWLGLICAKKEFPNVDSTNVEVVDSFMREVRTLVALHHPHIVKLLSTSMLESKPSFIMELMPMSLSSFIQELEKKGMSGKMPFDIAATIEMMLQIALGMQYLHEQGIVHRDLKSANILVAPSTHPQLRSEGYADIKLMDFGLAKMKVAGLVEPTVTYRGSTRHVSPEAVDMLPSQRIDWRKADVFSFGITCSEILTGETPYSREMSSLIRQKVKGGLRPTLPSACPPYLAELIKTCWAENPEERPSFEEIVHSLTRFRTLLLMGIEPDKERSTKSMLFWAELWHFNRNVYNNLFERRPVLCLDRLKKAQFEATIERHVFSKLDMVEALCSRMEEHLKNVQICQTQCEHLVRQYLEGVRKVKSMYNEAFQGTILWDLYLSEKLQSCSGCLDRFVCSMMAAEQLLRGCGQSEWKRTALTISAPLPQTRNYSTFGLCLWELYWNLFVIHHHMFGTRTRRSNTSLHVQSVSGDLLIHWCKERCKLTLRRITDPQDAEEEFLKADVDRQDADRTVLLAHIVQAFPGCIPCDGQQSRNIFSCIRSPEPPIEDYELADYLTKKLHSTSATTDFESRDDCYWIDELKFQNEVVIGLGPFKQITKSKWLGEVVAISAYDDGWDLEDFQREVEILVRVQHPNVVHFIGYTLNRVYRVCLYGYVMELMQGDLWDLIRRNSRLFTGAPFPLAVAIDILLQIVEAMVHLHNCGVVHRCLTPSRILVRPKYMTRSDAQDMDVYYNVKLASFSRAAMVVDKPLSSAVFQDFKGGLRPYMAPELLERSSGHSYTWSVDVWSFGMTAYHVISGSVPFELDISTKDLRTKLSERQLPPLDKFPHGSKKIIEQCWAADPQCRPSFEDIRKDLWTLKYNEEVTS